MQLRFKQFNIPAAPLVVTLLVAGIFITTIVLLAHPADRGASVDVNGVVTANPYYLTGQCSGAPYELCDPAGAACTSGSCLTGACIISGWLCDVSNPSSCVGSDVCGNGRCSISGKRCRTDIAATCDSATDGVCQGAFRPLLPDLDNCPGGPFSGACFDNFGIQVVCTNPDQADDNLNLLGDICDPCGNGRLDPTEACDTSLYADNASCLSLGFDGGTLACSDACQLDMAGCYGCGDGQVDLGEQCDDSNRNPNDGCSPTCTIEAYCGDRIVQTGEQCDDGGVCSIAGNPCRLSVYHSAQDCPAGETCVQNSTTNTDGCTNAGQGVNSCQPSCPLFSSYTSGVVTFPGQTPATQATFSSSGSAAAQLTQSCQEIQGNVMSATLEFAGNIGATAIVFVNDLSGSMDWDVDGDPTGSPSRLSLMKPALVTSMDQLFANTVINPIIGLVSFSGGSIEDNVFNEQACPLNCSGATCESFCDQPQQSVLENIVNNYSATGGTYTIEAVRLAKDILLASGVTNKIMVLMSDGDPTPGHDPISEATAAKNAGILVYSAAFTTDSGLQAAMSQWSSNDDANCDQTDGSGNPTGFCYSGTSIDTIYNAIINHILQQLPPGFTITINGVTTTFTTPNPGVYPNQQIQLPPGFCQTLGNPPQFNMTVSFSGLGAVTIRDVAYGYCPLVIP